MYKDPSTSVDALMDSGSSITLISKTLLKQWDIPLKPHRETFTVATKSPFATIGTATIPCRIEDTDVSLHVRVVPTLSSSLIIGMDTLKYLPVRFFYGERMLFSGHKPPQLKPRDNPELAVGEGIRVFSKDPHHTKVVRDLLIKHKDVVSQWTTTPGLIKNAAFRIPTGDAKPLYRSAIPLSSAHKELLQKHLLDYEERGMVRPSNSQWGAATFLVPKPGSSEMRTCHDYRPLNKVTERHQYPMPSANQLQDCIGTKNKFFAKVDLRWGYNQIPIETSDIPKTAITSPCGHHEWTVMNFGFSDAPAYFQSTIEKIIGDVLYKGVVVYLDDILIYAETFEEFERLLEIVLERLKNAGAKIHINKSDFLPSSLKYLGMVFSENGVQHLPDRVQKLNTYPPPETLKALRSFLGFANYFRSFIPNFASYERQLRQLPERHFLYTESDTKAFEAIRGAVSSTSTLATFDSSLQTQLHVDASGDGLGAVLCQIYPADNSTRVVAYASRLLTPAERRYTNTERELLAIEWAVCDRFRLKLLGQQFEVHTDHAALVNECRLKVPTSRIHRMLLRLDAYDCKIVYKPGRHNTAADFLSRLPDPHVSLEHAVICSVNADERVRVPAPDRRKLIEDYHVKALKHLGFKKTYDAICQRFFWPGMALDVKTFVKDCKKCQQFNTAAKPDVPVSPIESQCPKDILNIDVVGPLPLSNGHRYILVAIDHYSKYAFAVPVSHVNAQTVCHFLSSILSRYGSWKTIITDNARVFTGNKFSALLTSKKIQHRCISPRHPEANGAVERFIRTLRQLLRKNASVTSWAKELIKVVQAYNLAKHTATSVSPTECFLKAPPILPIDTKHNVKLSVVRSPSGVDQYRISYADQAKTWTPGTVVWHVPRNTSILKTSASHFQRTKLGPYTVVGNSSRPQHVTVTDGKRQWPLPLWELVI